MQVKHIESFLRLCGEGNMTRASEGLHITQQGLSRQLRSLEEELGVVLFERSKSGLSPTEICGKLFPHLKRMHEEYEAALGVIEAARRSEARSPLAIAFAIGISHCLNTDFLFDYQKSRKEANLEIGEWSQAACLRKLLEGELELAFLVNPPEDPRLSSIPLAEDYMFAAIHRDNPLAREDGPMDFALLDGERIITGSPDNALRGLFDRFCELSGIRPRIIVASSYSLDFVNAMREDAGIATVTSAMAARIANPDIVVRRLLTPERGVMHASMPRRARREKELSALLRYIKRYFETTPMRRFKEI